MITLAEFLQETGFSRNKHYPSFEELIEKFNGLNLSDDLQADILGYFLY